MTSGTSNFINASNQAFGLLANLMETGQFSTRDPKVLTKLFKKAREHATPYQTTLLDKWVTKLETVDPLFISNQGPHFFYVLPNPRNPITSRF